MASIVTPLILKIVNQAGAPLAVDKVTLTLGGSPVVKTPPPFSFDLSAAGNGDIVIEKSGQHTYQFAVDVKATATDFTASFSRSMIDAPRMASLVKVGAKRGSKKAGKNVLTVRIGPVREVVLLVGYDYHSNTTFRALGTARMHDIAAAGGLGNSTVVSFIEMQTGEISCWVRGRGKEKISPAFRWMAGWSRMTLQNNPTPNLDRTRPDYPGPGTIGMADFYRYVESVGSARPGSITELSVLSHSWMGGPILFNTRETTPFQPGGPQQTERDPDDKDARFWKDFNATNMPQKADFKAAFSSTSLVKIWGCFAVRAYRDMVQAALNAASDTQPLGIPASDRTLWFPPNTEFPDNRSGVLSFLSQSAFKANYMFQLSSAIGRPVFGGAPGMGALFLTTAFGLRMYIPAHKLSISGNKIVEGVAIDQARIDFLKSKLGWTFDSTNHMRFAP